jgi:hypothetical protein
MQGLLGWNLIVSLPAILLVAWLSGRLLGVSRGWAATVVAGLVGWLSALALSLAIAKGDPAAPGFGRNLWVFAVVFTMSSAVWMELLGALARAQTSLVSLPRPIRAVRRSGQRVSRYAEIIRIAVKHGFGPTWCRRASSPSCPASRTGWRRRPRRRSTRSWRPSWGGRSPRRSASSTPSRSRPRPSARPTGRGW